MKASITKAEVIMINLELDQPFRLGFGTLYTLPRVILRLDAKSERGNHVAVGEAAIDFPFCRYDMWDVYQALHSLPLVGSTWSTVIDEHLSQVTEASKAISALPAAASALNMAVDDLVGQLTEQPICRFYGQERMNGQALFSLPFFDKPIELAERLQSVSSLGFVPKPKVGQGVEKDAATIIAVGETSEIKQAVFDFNSTLTSEDFSLLVDILFSSGLGSEVFEGLIFEQPTLASEGVEGLIRASSRLQQSSLTVQVAADEVAVTQNDCLALAQHGIILNLKIQKVGGIIAARRIEQRVELATGQMPTSFVGGTFPTALGRAYDQHCAASLKSATLPGDGWLASTNWFSGEKHLIEEDFLLDRPGVSAPFSGPGLGVTPNWDKIECWRLNNPREAFRRLRQGEPSEIKFKLNGDTSYGKLYEMLNDGHSADWNL